MESKAAKQYFSRVQRCLVCPAASRHQLLGRGRRLVAQFEQENPNAQYSDFVSAFGSPGDFAGQMLSCVDSGAVEAVQRRRKLGRKTALVCLVLALCVTAVLGWVKWSQYEKYRDIFHNIKDADWVIVQHGPYKISEEEFYVKRTEVNISFSENGGKP